MKWPESVEGRGIEVEDDGWRGEEETTDVEVESWK